MSTTDDAKLAEEGQVPETSDAAAPAVEAAAEPLAVEAPAKPAVDPERAFRRELRRLPGKWYVIHSYSGYENKVKTNLETAYSNPRCRRLHFPGGVPRKKLFEIRAAEEDRQAQFCPAMCRRMNSMMSPGSGSQHARRHRFHRRYQQPSLFWAEVAKF